MTSQLAVVLIGLLGLALVLAPLVYPGELSHLSGRMNRWLYDRAARKYDLKWRSDAYRNPALKREMVGFATRAIAASGVGEVLDLGCGTGRGVRLLMPELPESTQYTAIDFSPVMLEVFREWLARQDAAVNSRVALQQADLAAWADGDRQDRRYGLVLLLEVGEFVPRFADLMARVASLLPPGAGLIATRPAGFWPLFFPGRKQTKPALTRLLVSLGFAPPQYLRWRGRYEIVLARKT